MSNEVRDFRLTIHEGFGPIPFFGFKPGSRTVKLLFLKSGGFKGFFLNGGNFPAVSAAFKRAPFFRNHLHFPVFILLHGEAAGKPVHQVHGFLIPGFQAVGNSTFGSAGAEPCSGNQAEMRYPEHAHIPIFPIGRKIANKKASSP